MLEAWTWRTAGFRLATRLARDAAGRFWRRHSQPAIDATPAQTTELIRLVTVAGGTLGTETTRMLHTWLTRPST